MSARLRLVSNFFSRRVTTQRLDLQARSIDISRVLRPGDNLVHETIRRCEMDLVQKTADFVKDHLADKKVCPNHDGD